MTPNTQKPLLLKSTHDQYYYGLNSGEIMPTGPTVEVPLSAGEGLLEDGNWAHIYFVYADGIWWLNRSVELINDVPDQSGWYRPIKPVELEDGCQKIGLKVFYTHGMAVFCEIVLLHKSLVYEIRARTARDANSKYYKLSMQIPIAEIDGTKLTKEQMWDYKGKDFEQRVWRKEGWV